MRKDTRLSNGLAAVILARDEAAHIVACVESVRWTDRVVVLIDPRNIDDTPALASQAGADVILNSFENYAQQRNDALRLVDAEWILFIDADERSSPEQCAEIRSVLEQPAHHGYWIPRHNYIFGRLTRHAGWYPDYQMRLLQRGHARYDPLRHVHELVILDGEPGFLTVPFVHFNYRDLRQFREKQRRYVSFDARILQEQGIQPRLHKFITRPLWHFYWRFVTLEGYKDGLHGLRLSLLMAWYELQKYRELRRLYRQP